jgi:hypothetical protein
MENQAQVLSEFTKGEKYDDRWKRYNCGRRQDYDVEVVTITENWRYCTHVVVGLLVPSSVGKALFFAHHYEKANNLRVAETL